MLDPKSVRKRVLLRMLGSPLVLAPFVLGMSALAVTWALGARIGLGLFAGLAGLLTTAGAFLTRLLLDNGRTAQSIVQEAQGAEQQDRQAALDDLDRRLTTSDDDPRPEAALRDLRALRRAFEELSQQSDAVSFQILYEVREKVDQLFEQSIRSLEQTLKLGETAAQLSTAAARKPILTQRECIVDDVEAGVKKLGATLASIQGLNAGGSRQAGLSRLRDELDQSLALAGRVEDRLNALLDQTTSEVHTQPVSNPQKG